MPTPHNEAKINEISKTVIMPGDPLRAKYIAENFLENYKLVNSVRCAYCYTGNYKNKEISVMASGMGMPSMGIYCYELYKDYDVDNIIRIGSCGGYLPEFKLFDIVLSKQVYSESNFAYTLNNENCHIVNSSSTLDNLIIKTAKEKNINLFYGDTICTDCFDLYMTDKNKFMDRIPKNIKPLAAEMEAFALFYVAKLLNKNASCLMSVVDSQFIDKVASPEERQTGLNTMIKLALDSSLNIK